MNQIIILNKKTKITPEIKSKGLVIDVTSKATDLYVELSPFYPIGNLEVPFVCAAKSECVEGIWQGLKVFENEGIDVKTFRNGTMKNIKRTVRKHGKVLGHYAGKDQPLLSYLDARYKIYIPAYNQQIELFVKKHPVEVKYLKYYLKNKGNIYLLDYNTNEDVDDTSKPLSHASLFKKYLLK